MSCPSAVTDVTPDTLAGQLSHLSHWLRKWNGVNYTDVLRSDPV